MHAQGFIAAGSIKVAGTSDRSTNRRQFLSRDGIQQNSVVQGKRTELDQGCLEPRRSLSLSGTIRLQLPNTASTVGLKSSTERLACGGHFTLGESLGTRDKKRAKTKGNVSNCGFDQLLLSESLTQYFQQYRNTRGYACEAGALTN